MKNVLVDRHHAGLYHSLQLLGDRLGWDIYTPVGMDWWDEWYWSFGRSTYNDDRLARQYLDVGSGAWAGSRAVSENVQWVQDGDYPDRWIHGLTLADAKRQRWDYVIATLQDNQMGFAKFAREHGARFVVQVGNTGQNIEWEFDPLVLNSSEMPLVGSGVVYHQEFDSTGTFGYREPSGSAVRCFVHLLHETICYPLWQEFRGLVTDRDVLRYGHAPVVEDPSWVENVKPTSRIADLMAESAWGWHDKPHGDGFGHVLHGWAAIGRPLIGHASHYKGKMAEPFWRDMETCIDLNRHSVAEAAEIVQGISADEHAKMSRAIRQTFDELVDYDREAEMIRELLEPAAVAA